MMPTSSSIISEGLVSFDGLVFALSEYVIHPLITLILCLLSVFVVLGNLLVVSAIWHENQMHSVTNYLIASLAAADCLVGAVVMPFSIISEIIIGSWTFGAIWCDLWHSFDVLASTASIMNLCAISLDRYLAITDPISYPSRMTPKIVALLIVSLWTCSSLISFPAILWWRAVGQGPLERLSPAINRTNLSPQPLLGPASTVISSLEISPSIISDYALQEVPQYRCVFTDNTAYLLFSSFVSFYGPLCVMLYAYYRIYKAAVQQTRFLKHGSKQVVISRSKKGKRSRHATEQSVVGLNDKNGTTEAICDASSNPEMHGDGQHLVLRVHRGGGGGSTNTMSFSTSPNRHSQKNNIITNSKRQELVLDLESSNKLAANIGHNEAPNKLKKHPPSHSTEDLNQSILSGMKSSRRSVERSFERNQSPPGRKGRFDFNYSKRDKLRMDSQRFDLKPSSSDVIAVNISNSNTSVVVSKAQTSIDISVTGGAYVEARRQERGDSSTTDESEADEKLAAASRQTNMGLSKPKRSQHVQSRQQQRQSHHQKSRPLLASMNNRSSSIDACIIKHIPPSEIGSDQQKRQANQNSNLRYTTNCHQRDSSFINIAGNDINNTDRKIIHCYCTEDGDEELSDDFVRRNSVSSSSSGTYGTGSIVSVLVRPQQQQFNPKNASEVRPQNEDCCNANDSFSGNLRSRRASSFGESKRKESGQRLPIGEKDGMAAIPASPPGECNDALLRRHNYRASCGDQSAIYSRSSEAPDGFSTTKSLNLRSWVRLKRMKTRKNDSTNQTDGLIKPPSSLLPLMMMNSDTSTDSSITTNSIMKADKKSEHEDDRIKDISSADDFANVTSKQDRDIHSKVHANKSNGDQSSDPNSGLATSNAGEIATRCNPITTDKNLSFREDIERGESSGGKAQMVYYDSDKLIQSIVDLTAIHYIDCANQGSKHTTNVNNCDIDDLRNNVQRSVELSSDPQERVQSSEGSRAIMTRQHKSVGRKLSKLAKERKAAKTLGIVVGVFILCWLPFFVVNIVVALCGIDCIYKPHILNSIVTWLGWLNSAMNPVIYACWSRDFRRAFRRVLCTWVEFICPYEGANVARKLKLKKSSNYSSHDAYLSRNVSSIKNNTSSATIRSGVSFEVRGHNNNNNSSINGGVSRGLLSDHH